MNNDNNGISPQPSKDQALEARIVAWVLGEASEFEIAELARTISERPALAAFKARIEATHHLMRKAAGSEKAPLRLSAPRRAALLAALGVAQDLTATDESRADSAFEKSTALQPELLAAAASAAPTPTAKPSEKSSVFTYPMAQRRAMTSTWVRRLSIACSLMLTFVVLHLTVIAPKSRRYAQIASPVERANKLNNFSGLGQGSPLVLTEDTARPNENTPIRGLAFADKTKDFFLTDIPWDSYKHDRTDLQPGPNSILIGQGSPAGIINAVSKGASFRNFLGDARKEQDEVAAQFSERHRTEEKLKFERTARQPVPVSMPAISEPRDAPEAPVSAPGLVASQEAPDPLPSDTPVNDVPVQLDSFEVKADEVQGYAANSTLAGTRIRTELSLPSFDKNTESSGSIDIARGKSSTLFGSGSPAGIVNSSNPGRQKSFISQLSPRSSSAPVDPSSDEKAESELSPFVASAPEPVGSMVASSAAVSHQLNAELSDSAPDLSITTSNFVKDVGATDSSNLLQYTSNTDSSGVGPIESDQTGTDQSPPKSDTREKKKTLIAPTAGKPAMRSKVVETEEQSAQTQPVSTFSLHVSDVSFRLAADQLAAGEMPDASTIRPEEFYNAFDYGDPAPAAGEKVNCRIEQSAHPTKQQRNLLRIAMRVPSTGRAAMQPLRLTILLDTSGSMQRRDRAASVKDAVTSLVSLLTPNDRVTLIGFSRTPHLLAESVSGDEAKRLVSILSKTPAEGGTNFDAALTLAGELAQRQQNKSAQNRIVLVTDGAANLGDADPKQLSTKIEQLRQKGIAFDACGVGTSGIDDAMLESLTRHGDGRYLLLDRTSASAEFAKQLAGAFRPAAKNVKVQVRFNPNRVAHYRLLGFAQHRLKEEDFRNDRVDAAELAADEAATALYEVEPLPTGEGALGEVFVRFQDTATGEMVERSWTLPYDAQANSFDRASPSLQLAGSAMLIAEYLQGRNVNLDDLVAPINHLRDHYRDEPRVQTLVTMFDQLRRLDRRP